MSDTNTLDRTIETLRGFSPSTGEAPKFEPIASQHDDYRILDRPMMRSTSERLAELVGEYQRTILFYNAASSAEDNAEDGTSKERPSGAVAHAARVLKELESAIEALPAASIYDLGLKARVVSWSTADLWDTPDCDEHGARNLVDNVLILAGMDRILRKDFEFSELLPGYAGPPRYDDGLADIAGGPDQSISQPATELEKLSADFLLAVRRHSQLDLAIVGQEGKGRPSLAARMDNQSDRISMIEERASFLKANSAREALFQIALAHNEMDNVYSWVGVEPEQLDKLAADRAFRSVGRLLYSIRGVLEKVAGVSADSLTDAQHMAAKFDPFMVEADDEAFQRLIAEADADREAA